MPKFRESSGKKTVRENWNTPFLRYLHSKYGIRYRYMGLPGTELNDVKLWADMIDEVIAFEVKDKSRNGRKSIEQLRKNLALFNKPSIAYFGSFEEVVILRQDWDGQNYNQNQLITLYNLDFCDEISSRIETREFGKQVWRFEAIRQILFDQKECYRAARCPCFFIIILTVRNQISSDKILGFLRTGLYQDTQRYYDTCQSINPIPCNSQHLIGTHTWSLKAFLHNLLRSYFSSPNICSLFFPLVKYQGTPVKKGSPESIESPMINLMIFCKFGPPESPNPLSYPFSYLQGVCSLRANDDGTLILESEPGEPNNSGQELSPDIWFQSYENLFFPQGTQELKSLSARYL